MQELDFSSNTKKKVKIKFSEDESYMVRLPSMTEVRDFGRRQAKVKDDFENIDLVIELLESLGLPKEKSEALDSEQMTSLKDMVLAVKKN